MHKSEQPTLWRLRPQVRLCMIGQRVFRNARLRLHRHPFHELGIVHEGRCGWQLAEGLVWVGEGEAILVPTEGAHDEVTDPGASSRVTWLGFSFAGGDPPDLPRWLGHALPAGEHWAEVRQRLDSLSHEMAATRLGGPERLEWLVQDILLLLCRGAAGPEPAPVNPPASVHQSAQVQAATHFIRENYAHALRIADVARSVGLSHAHFATIFRQCLGQTPSQYLWHVRLHAARQLLRQGDFSLKEVAARCGYGDAPHLCHRFRAALGVTPAQYRRQRP